MMKKLTPKQESFCVKYCETGDRTEAYKFAYDCKNAKQSTITNNAYKLLQNGEITARIKEIDKNVEQSVLWTKKQMISQLQAIVLSNESTNTEKIQAIRQATNMLGYDKEEENTNNQLEYKLTLTRTCEKCNKLEEEQP